MKLSEVKTPEKAGSPAGAAALQTFFVEMQQDSDALEAFLDKMVAAGGGVTTYGVPFLTFIIKPDKAGYTVRVRLETEDIGDLILHKDMPDGTSVDFDSPVETYVTFHLASQAAIDVALADEDDAYETMQHLFAHAGGYIHRVEKEFGQTREYAQQVEEE